MEPSSVPASNSRHVYLATCNWRYDVRVIELLCNEKMNVYERVRLHLFAWLNDLCIFIFTWHLRLVLIERLAIYHSVLKRTSIVVLSWGKCVCSGWHDILKYSYILFQTKFLKKGKGEMVAELRKFRNMFLEWQNISWLVRILLRCNPKAMKWIME